MNGVWRMAKDTVRHLKHTHYVSEIDALTLLERHSSRRKLQLRVRGCYALLSDMSYLLLVR